MKYDWDVEAELRRWMKLFQDGIITRYELVNQVFDNVLHPQFFNVCHMLPDDLLEEVKEKAKHCPAHPEDFLMLHNPWFHGPDLDLEAIQRDRECRERIYWQERLTFELFHPGLTLPEFVPIILAGVVKEVAEIEGMVAIIGANSLQIRQHPVHLVRSDGSRLITQVVDDRWVKRDCDNDSPDELLRKDGKRYLFLAENVRSIEDAPIGTEVWIDRTNAPPIPPRPADL